MKNWLAALVLAAACSAPNTPVAQSVGADGSAEPRPPNAPQYQPAFPGQTRAPNAPSGVTVAVEDIASGLEFPWALEFLPDGRVLVTERPGRIRIVSRDGAVSAPLEGLPPVVAQGQGGLLDVALSPSFARDRMIYWSYAEPREEGRNGTSVARARLSRDNTRLEQVQVIFRQEPAWASNLHFGSRLVWDRNGHLFVTLGERSQPDARPLAQNLDGLLGKTVRIGADGSIPRDNPFVNMQAARGEIWSHGQRNIQGAALHPETGQLWTIEHGPRGGDELNIVEAGKNYGWPVITYGVEYSGQTIGDGLTQRDGMEQPIYYWDPVIAPGGIAFYQGDLFPWAGDLIIASLRGGVVRLDLDGARVTGEERLAAELGRVRDVQIGPDGAIWAAVDGARGRLVRLTHAR